MQSTSFRCPHCGKVQAKSEIDKLLSGGYSVSFDSGVVICALCGESIDRAAIISGKLDVKNSGCLGDAAELIGCGLILVVAGALIWWLWRLFAGE